MPYSGPRELTVLKAKCNLRCSWPVGGASTFSCSERKCLHKSYLSGSSGSSSPFGQGYSGVNLPAEKRNVHLPDIARCDGIGKYGTLLVVECKGKLDVPRCGL